MSKWPTHLLIWIDSSVTSCSFCLSLPKIFSLTHIQKKSVGSYTKSSGCFNPSQKYTQTSFQPIIPAKYGWNMLKRNICLKPPTSHQWHPWVRNPLPSPPRTTPGLSEGRSHNAPPSRTGPLSFRWRGRASMVQKSREQWGLKTFSDVFEDFKVSSWVGLPLDDVFFMSI